MSPSLRVPIWKQRLSSAWRYIKPCFGKVRIKGTALTSCHESLWVEGICQLRWNRTFPHARQSPGESHQKVWAPSTFFEREFLVELILRRNEYSASPWAKQHSNKHWHEHSGRLSDSSERNEGGSVLHILNYIMLTPYHTFREGDTKLSHLRLRDMEEGSHWHPQEYIQEYSSKLQGIANKISQVKHLLSCLTHCKSQLFTALNLV